MTTKISLKKLKVECENIYKDYREYPEMVSHSVNDLLNILLSLEDAVEALERYADYRVWCATVGYGSFTHTQLEDISEVQNQATGGKIARDALEKIRERVEI